MDALSPTTELEAVNMMLATIGESPVNTLEDNGVVDAVLARAQLTAMSKRMQAKGWHWNTDKDFRLAPSFPSKEIKVPRNTLRIDTTGSSAGVDVVLRGQRLYDRRKHTFQFDQALVVDLVSFLPFEDLGETARQYLMLASARKFQQAQVGSEILNSFTMRDELLALADLLNEDGEVADYNVITDNPSMVEMLFR